MIRHPFNRTDIDLTALRAALAARLGQPVELLTSGPTADDPDGVLIVEDPDTNAHLDVDPVAVAEVVAAQPSRVTEAARAIAEYDAATTLVGKLAAWRASLGRQEALEQAGRERARMVRLLAQRHGDTPRR